MMIILKNVKKEYSVGNQKIEALKGVDFSIEAGQFTVILGPSGSGKSTLLNILGGMDKASSGEYRFLNQNIHQYSEKELSLFRREQIGFVFQFYNLVPSLTAYENVAIAAKLTGHEEKSFSSLESVGLGHRKNNFPKQLSGGEMQRVSIARALAKSPKLLLCDEPTGALDSVTSLKILNILKDVSKRDDTAVVMVTHNAEFAKVADKVIRLHDGKIESIAFQDSPSPVEEVAL